MMTKSLFVYILILIFVQGADFYSLDDVMTLHRRLLNDSVYDKTLRPGNNQSLPTTVNIRMRLTNLIDIDEIAGTMKITGKLIISWVDDRIVWNPKGSNGVRNIFIPQGKVWVPDMYSVSILNGQSTAIGMEKLMVKYTSKGEAVWDVTGMFWSTCNIQITLYPVDEQKCMFRFFPNGYSSDDIQFEIADTEIMSTNYQDNSVWKLQHSKVFINKGNPTAPDQFIVRLTFARRSTMYIVSILVPTSLMGFVHLLAFFIPDETGERVGFSVTILLSLAVYQSMLSETLPKASVPQIPVLSIKIFADLMISSLIQVSVVFSQYLYNKEGNQEDLPGPISCFIRCLQSRKRKQKVKPNENYSYEEKDLQKEKEETMERFVDVKNFRRKFNIVCGWFCFLAILGTNISILAIFLQTSSNEE